jgi:hypothetical protein
MRHQASTESWKLLESILTDLRVGDVVTVDQVAGQTGMTSDTVDVVLAALTRAGLFAQLDNQYTRCPRTDWFVPSRDSNSTG